jgi:hypothetical protein
MQDINEKLLRAAEIAKHLRLTRQNILKLTHDGLLPVRVYGTRSYRYSLNDVLAAARTFSRPRRPTPIL